MRSNVNHTSLWPRVALGSVGSVICGQSPPRSAVNRDGIGIPYVSGPEHWDGATVHLDKWTSRPMRQVPGGCVFITVKGAGVGTVFPGVSCAIGRDIYAFNPTEKLDRKFLEHALRHTASEIIRSARGDIPGLSKNHLTDHEVILPPVSQQRRIVAEIEKQFTRLDAGIAALRNVQAKLKRYRAAVLKAACEGRLVPTEAEIAQQGRRDYESGEDLLVRMLGERRGSILVRGKYKEPQSPDIVDLPNLPVGWSWASADQITSVITDGEHITPERSATGILLLSPRNVLDGRISVEDVDYVPQHEYDRISKRLVVAAGDVLLSCSGSVGRSTVVPEGMLFTLVRSVAVLKPMLGIGKYLSIALRSPLFKRQITTKQTQTAQANIFQGKIKALCVPLPPLAEQKRIVAEVECRLSVVEELEAVVSANLQRAARLGQTILQKAFFGELVKPGVSPPVSFTASLIMEIKYE